MQQYMGSDEIPESTYRRMAQLAETSESPLIITEGGRARFALLDVDAYYDLITVRKVMRGIEDSKRGRFTPLDELKKEFDAEYRV